MGDKKLGERSPSPKMLEGGGTVLPDPSWITPMLSLDLRKIDRFWIKLNVQKINLNAQKINLNVQKIK